jgi:hypothetical protein
VRSGRHRVLWLAAVFLALAAGVMLGSFALSGPLVSGLRGDKGSLQQQNATLGDENRVLNGKLTAADTFDSQMAARMVRDALAGKSVVLLRTPDAEDSDVDAVSRLVGRAGGAITATIGLTDEFVHGNAAEKLQSVVNSPIVPAGAKLNTTLVDPSAQAGDLLGIALMINRDPKIAPVDDAARDAVLAALRDTGFLAYGDRPGAANAAVVVTGGALPADAGNEGLTVARFAAALAPRGSGVVLAGRDGSATGVSAVAVARADAGLSSSLTTVDDIGLASGRITAVLGVQSLIAGGPPGKYGSGDGAAEVTVPQ